MNRKTIAILFGGDSPEHQVSKMSAATVMQAISDMNDKYEALPVYITDKGSWLLQDERHEGGITAVLSPDAAHKGLIILPQGKPAEFRPVDAVFPVLHGKNGEDGAIQGLCQLAGIPCVGSGVMSSAICMDKDIARRLVKDVSHTEYMVLDCDDVRNPGTAAEKIQNALGFPCFVKPANAGSSLGITKAENLAAAAAAIRTAACHDRKILAEKAVVGRELEVGVLGNDEPQASEVGEIVAPTGFYDYKSKYVDDNSQVVTPADLPLEMAEQIKQAAIGIFNTLECRGMARVDFFLERGTNKLLFSEINTIPGFTAISMYAKAFAAAGINLTQLVAALIDFAIDEG